ncbi:DNA polymerase III subunit delta' [Desertibacillus haloalkaliphilus]|uniref:DNA polymerase III subunit delta' n=1 Tax=Desertibacillus haloalkaliphilus TaxID=1328930 RepID=UPI001C257CF3|nr:DNA polymerase III subunit delta' [Desertibacillus haloalkaliphilus]MBU8908408.1 DNA polymerase III subunit delta' [Desertibacillus haloalkaliphilus]
MSWQEVESKQPTVAKVLTNSIIRDRLAHAYLFEGKRGTGKKEVAYELAKSHFCQHRNGAEPCQQCAECKRITSGNHPDVHFIAPEGQSIKKGQVEHLQKEFTYRGVESKKKVYIIADAEQMTASAANSLLKFLEEPEGPTIAILLTEQPQRILNTVLSRSQVISFSPLPPGRFSEQLVNRGIAEPVAKVLAELTNDLREADEFCEDDWIVQARNLVIQLTGEVHERPHQVMFTLQDKWINLFKSKDEVNIGLDLILLWYRDILFVQLGETDQITYIDQANLLQKQALSSSRDKLTKQMTAILEAKRHLSANVNTQLLMEKLLLRLQEG